MVGQKENSFPKMKVTVEENQSLIAKSGKLTGIFGAGHAGLKF